MLIRKPQGTELPWLLVRRGVPVVSLLPQTHFPACFPQISVDRRKIGSEAVAHLVAQGYRRIADISGVLAGTRGNINAIRTIPSGQPNDHTGAPFNYTQDLDFANNLLWVVNATGDNVVCFDTAGTSLGAFVGAGVNDNPGGWTTVGSYY